MAYRIYQLRDSASDKFKKVRIIDGLENSDHVIVELCLEHLWIEAGDNISQRVLTLAFLEVRGKLLEAERFKAELRKFLS